MSKLSLCMIVKDEEKLLKTCLESVKEVVDEIIITDTGSSDNTVAIAEKYADKIEYFKWIDDFSAARNYCAKFATYDFIMTWDADNILDSQSLEVIHELKANNFAGIALVSGMWHVEVGQNNQPIKTLSKAIIYNKNKLLWSGSIHEQLVPVNSTLKIKSRTISAIEFTHHKDRQEKAARYKQNLKLTEVELTKEPNNPRLTFFYGESLVDAKKFKQAETVFQNYLDNYKNVDATLSVLAIEKLLVIYLNTHRNKAALSLVETHFTDYSEDPRFNLVYADAVAANDIQAAAKYYENYLRNPITKNSQDSYYDHERYFIHPRWMLANIKLLSQDKEKARKLLQIVIDKTYINEQKLAATKLLEQIS